MREAGASEAEIRSYEASKMATLSKQERIQKSAEIRKARSLLFYQELKNRRRKKIKSRKYRKILKKQKEKNSRSLAELEEEDPEAGLAQRRRIEENRAEERMTLRHRNSRKWAKQMLRSGAAKDPEVRKALEEQLRKGEELRRKQLEESDEMSGEESIELSEDPNAPDLDNPAPGSLMAMKFMKKANERKKKEAAELLEQLREAEEEDGSSFETSEDESDISSEADAKKSDSSVKFEGNTTLITQVGSDASFKSSVIGKISAESPVGMALQRLRARQLKKRGRTTPNTSNGPSPVKKRVKIDERESKKKQQSALESLLMPADEEEGEEVKKRESNGVVHGGDDEVEEDQKGGFKLFQGASKAQKDLIRKAFAGDDVHRAFQQKKSELINENNPKKEEIEQKIPGWGDWAGEGVIPRKVYHDKRKRKRKGKGKGSKEISKGKSNRKDKGMSGIIISEKVDKKASKYKIERVPYPYTSIEQYERALSHPLGREWNTKTTFENLIKPSIQVKTGVFINPIEFNREAKLLASEQAEKKNKKKG